MKSSSTHIRHFLHLTAHYSHYEVFVRINEKYYFMWLCFPGSHKTKKKLEMSKVFVIMNYLGTFPKCSVVQKRFRIYNKPMQITLVNCLIAHSKNLVHFCCQVRMIFWEIWRKQNQKYESIYILTWIAVIIIQSFETITSSNIT